MKANLNSDSQNLIACAFLFGAVALAAALPPGYDILALFTLVAIIWCPLAVTFYRKVIK